MNENNANVYNTNNEINISSNKINTIIINSQKQKKYFEFKAEEQQQRNKIGLNNNIYSNKFYRDPDPFRKL